MNQIYLRQSIEKASLDKRWLKIDFVDKKLKITRDRVIEPMRLKVKNGEDYVEANCYLRNDYREFPLIGIQKIAVISPADYNKGNDTRT